MYGVCGDDLFKILKLVGGEFPWKIFHPQKQGQIFILIFWFVIQPTSIQIVIKRKISRVITRKPLKTHYSAKG